mmetsp:Transcript_7156/g.13700  ORF Transcript_7156/g.13700 Transcript_7156/m.13700 type:complete len:221 (-) Transcript_7156:1262-1924(-)
MRRDRDFIMSPTTTYSPYEERLRATMWPLWEHTGTNRPWMLLLLLFLMSGESSTFMSIFAAGALLLLALDCTSSHLYSCTWELMPATSLPFNASRQYTVPGVATCATMLNTFLLGWYCSTSTRPLVGSSSLGRMKAVPTQKYATPLFEPSNWMDMFEAAVSFFSRGMDATHSNVCPSAMRRWLSSPALTASHVTRNDDVSFWYAIRRGCSFSRIVETCSF